MIYQPREDSYFLAEFVKKFSKNKIVLDVGSGSGILALTAKRAGAKVVEAIDINEEAIKIIKRKGISAWKSDIFSKVRKKYDLIISNPPYLPLDLTEDKESALTTTGGKKGDEFLCIFLKKAGKYLRKEGNLLILLSSLTPTKRLRKISKEQGYEILVLAEKSMFMETLYIWKLKKIPFKTKKIST